jgi:cobalt/nickel transport system ATP-binding protein
LHHTVEIDDLSYSYHDGHEALKRVTLHIGEDEKVALLGPNGAGKSTLMLHLNGILHSHGGGRVAVGGLPVDEKNLGQIRAWVGLVFQSPDDQLFNPRVFEDVAFGPLHMGLPDDEVRRRSLEALKAVGMEGYANRISHHLSIGEKKRTMLVATHDIPMVQELFPRTVVMDEGQIVADGETTKILSDASFLEAHGLEKW